MKVLFFCFVSSLAFANMNMLEDQRESTDTYAIPLDNSAEEDEWEMETLKKEEKRLQKERAKTSPRNKGATR